MFKVWDYNSGEILDGLNNLPNFSGSWYPTVLRSETAVEDIVAELWVPFWVDV